MSYYDTVYALVRKIPRGRVATYGQLAFLTGSPRAARAVGYAMRACTDPTVPCHRVIGKSGVLSAEHAFGRGVQRALLESEGVAFTEDGRALVERFRWDGA
ncbi:MAG: MGMT family protein [Clostridia bacterium]|nr:MGMT family protein [Clostridia bacterium]